MYVPEHFYETSSDEICRIIRDFPLGTLITQGANGLDANQLPFELMQTGKENGLLRAHVARANPIWKDVAENDETLVVFKATDAYISPNWYPSKHETHRLVPTWNYQVVNVHGRIRFIDDAKFLRSVVGRLTHTHESKTEGQAAWRMGDAPRDYMAAMLDAIVGVEIAITRIVAKSKLSQNREARDRVSAAEVLAQHGHAELSEALKFADRQR
jgi:transcriptional regulator